MVMAESEIETANFRFPQIIVHVSTCDFFHSLALRLLFLSSTTSVFVFVFTTIGYS